jgi:site-specific DNA-cytosine methylase
MAKIIIACEFSGIVREAFKARGHDVWSCDLLPTDIPGNHIQDDVLRHLNDGWDMMIAFPPCTHLAVSGAAWFTEKIKDGRQQKAIKFFMDIANAHIPTICIENPIGIMSTIWRKPNQIIQPWQFGHPETKATCLWLKNLVHLEPSKIVRLPEKKSERMRLHYLPPSPDRWKLRSITFQGVADAMANQWG